MDYTEEYLDELKASVNLLEYAQKDYDFEHKNRNYYTNCPLHSDKTPSLSINPEKNLFYCFSCGRGGSIINWLMDFEGKTFDEAVKKTAELSGKTVPSGKVPNAIKIYSEMRKLNNEKQAEVVHDKVNISILDSYSDEIPIEWVDEGISPEIMKKYQVKIDKSNNRIVYPVYSNDGDLIGIKGRTRYKDFKILGIAKYMNYYKISCTDFLQGLYQNRQNVIRKNEIILFEGIKSGMKAEDWGFNNWASTETSTINEYQSNALISLHISDIVVAYDSDVNISKVMKCTDIIRKFCNVYMIVDKDGLLGGADSKNSPADCGREIFEKLYKEKIKL